jgi:hypothetical protein
MLRARLFGIILAATFIMLSSVVLIARSNNRPAQADAPHPGLDFSIGADVNGDGVDDCDTSGGPSSCYTTSDSVIATVYLNDLGDLESYRGFAALIKFDGMRSKSDAEVLWPDCRSRFDGGVVTGVGSFSLHPSCKEPNENRTSQYVGPLVRFGAFCSPGGALRLRHDPVPAGSGDAQTMLFDKAGVTHSESGYEELSVHCASTPTPYPTSTPTPVPPTPTPAPTCPPAGCAPLNFAIGIDVDGDGTNDCGSGVPLAVGDGAPDPVPIEVKDTTCEDAADAELTVRVYLMDSGGVAYFGAGIRVDYSGMTSLGFGASVWSGCNVTFSAQSSGLGYEVIDCLSKYITEGGGSTIPVRHVGLMAVFRFSCGQGGPISLAGATALFNDEMDLHGNPLGHSENGPDKLSVTCGDRTPLPTFTPTATPTPTAGPTPCPGDVCPSPEFAIGIDVNGDGTNDCGSGVPLAVGDGAPDPVAVKVTNTDCHAVRGGALGVNVYLMDNDRVLYEAQASSIAYTGIVSKDRGDAVWDGCVFEAAAPVVPGFENVGCTTGVSPALPMSHVGLMSRFSFTCAEDGTITLDHGAQQTALWDERTTAFGEHNGSDVLTVDCGVRGPPLAGDSDCNGATNSIDATLVLQYSAGLMAMLPCGDSADVNNDGVVDSRDAALILQHTAGLVAGLG